MLKTLVTNTLLYYNLKEGVIKFKETRASSDHNNFFTHNLFSPFILLWFSVTALTRFVVPIMIVAQAIPITSTYIQVRYLP